MIGNSPTLNRVRRFVEHARVGVASTDLRDGPIAILQARVVSLANAPHRLVRVEKARVTHAGRHFFDVRAYALRAVRHATAVAPRNVVDFSVQGRVAAFVPFVATTFHKRSCCAIRGDGAIEAIALFAADGELSQFGVDLNFQGWRGPRRRCDEQVVKERLAPELAACWCAQFQSRVVALVFAIVNVVVAIVVVHGAIAIVAGIDDFRIARQPASVPIGVVIPRWLWIRTRRGAVVDASCQSRLLLVPKRPGRQWRRRRRW